ncbi:MAG: hypothetical protein H0W61_12060 [Bacteroidetes bacterium]|nr:hypothetical protein [Bacteroidota bacterium]
MKNLILIASASLIMISCNRGELERSNQQRDSLMAVIRTNDMDRSKQESSLNDFVTSFNEVERNLDSVAVRQQIIYLSADKNRGEIKGSQKERINAHIAAINELMDANRKSISELKTRLKRSANKNSKLEKAVAVLTEQVASKDQELAELNDKLIALNVRVEQLQSSLDTLTTQNNSQSQTIAQNTEVLHTAFYVVGKSKELAEAKIIDKKGGLLGIGKSTSLQKDFDKSRFTKIDYTKMTSIPVNSDKVKIITNHPSDSYTLEKDSKEKNVVRNIIITNPEKFWSVSKYLVVTGTPVSAVTPLTKKESSKVNTY